MIENLRKREYTAKKKLLWMTIVMCIPSFIIHLLCAVAFLLQTFSISNKKTFLYHYILCIGIFCLAFKTFLNFFIFYFFNTNFQIQFKSLIFKMRFPNVWIKFFFKWNWFYYFIKKGLKFKFEIKNCVLDMKC